VTALLRHGLGVNVAQMVPHGSVRGAVLGSDDRAPTAAEMTRMQTLVRDGMAAGAFGLSSGPYYAPGSFATTDELVELARVAARVRRRLHSSHIRDEADYDRSGGRGGRGDPVAREAGLPGIVTHIKALGPRVWGYAGALVKRIERARDAGVEVYADQYPYEASSTSLAAALLPRWAQAGGGDSLRARLPMPITRAHPQSRCSTTSTGAAAPSASSSRRGPTDSVEGTTLAALRTTAERRACRCRDLHDRAAAARASYRSTWTMTTSSCSCASRGP
jgi:N-acyl-D-aspartate/D-glutamate deacylase